MTRRASIGWLMTLLCVVLCLTGCRDRISKVTSFFHREQEDVVDEIDLDAFKKINISMITSNVTIRRGSKYHLTVTRPKKFKVDSEVAKKTLVIRDGKIGQDGSAEIEITIPGSATLKTITGSVDVGTVVLKNVKAKEADLYSGVGNCTVKKCDIKTIEANADVGTITFKALKGIKNTGLNLSVETGNVYWKNNSRGSSFSRKKGKRFITSHVDEGDIWIK